MADVVDRIAPAAARANPAEATSRNAVALNALKVLRRVIEGDAYAGDDVEAEIDTLREHFNLPAPPSGDADDEDDLNFDEFDVAEMQEALARARCGQIEDCIIHLGRALPQEFSGIADALERSVERRR